nr:type II secretion system protein [uncultured Campylobacter sp.]
MKKAFTMVELIFVIVILGILAMVALPRLAGSKKDAEITRAKAEIAAIRSAIQTYRGANLLSQKPGSGYPDDLKAETIEKITNGTKLGSNWTVNEAGDTLTLTIAGDTTTFNYDKAKGSLTCSGDSSTLCGKIEK